MFEKRLVKLIEEAKTMRKSSVENGSASFFYDNYYELSKFILNKLQSRLFRKRNAAIIAEHFDDILPLIVTSNMNIILADFNLLVKQPNFKWKFIEGLKKYPYDESIDAIFYNMWVCMEDEPGSFDEFLDVDVLTTLATINANMKLYSDILNRVNEENQRIFLNLLVENRCDIPYSRIKFQGNNKQIIYDNLPVFIETAQNLYALLNFVSDNPLAVSQVKEYMDQHDEQAINSIFCETDKLGKIKDSSLKETIRAIILEVMKNENVSFSDITYSAGGFSRVILLGDKVIKLGNRKSKTFPNNPYIIAPVFRKELEVNGESCFVEITERVDTSKDVRREELYQLFKKLRDLNLVWTDIKIGNVGRLKRDNVVYWKEETGITEELLGLEPRRGEEVLKEGDLVILDADFIFDENDLNIEHTNNKVVFDEFEERYQKEKAQQRSHNNFIQKKVEVEDPTIDEEIVEERRVRMK